MGYTLGSHEQRESSRVSLECPAQVSIGSQLTIKGYLKDISFKSAFIRIKYSVYLQLNDEVGFVIQPTKDDQELIQGLGRISRIVPGEGLVIYFTKLDEASLARLKKLC